MVNHEIGKYSILHWGKRQLLSREVAKIYLYNPDDRYIGYVAFYRNDQEIPDNSCDELSVPKQVHLRMHQEHLDSVVDMLRNEKPCFLLYNTPTYAYIWTGSEPVGEEETE